MHRNIWLLVALTFCLVQATLGQNVVEAPEDTIVDLDTETAKLECRVSSSFDNGGTTLLWGIISDEFDNLFLVYSDGNVVRTGADNRRFDNFEIVKNGNYNYDMVISDVEVDDEGEYVCYTGNKPENGAKLLVQAQAKLEIDENEDYVEVTEGEEKTIECSADSANPPSNFTWYKNTVEFACYNPNQQECYRDLGTNDDDTTDTRSRHVFKPTFEDHNKTITCESLQEWDSENKVDSVADSITLNVQYYPRVIVTWSTLRREATCNVNANPDDDIYYEWYINGEADDQRTDTWKMDWGEDVTKITCFATNKIGTGNHTLYTNVDGANATRYNLTTTLLAIIVILVFTLSN